MCWSPPCKPNTVPWREWGVGRDRTVPTASGTVNPIPGICRTGRNSPWKDLARMWGVNCWRSTQFHSTIETKGTGSWAARDECYPPPVHWSLWGVWPCSVLYSPGHTGGTRLEGSPTTVSFKLSAVTVTLVSYRCDRTAISRFLRAPQLWSQPQAQKVTNTTHKHTC